MSGWSDFSSLAKSAKAAISTAQKQIDKVLDIKEDPNLPKTSSSQEQQTPIKRLQDDFFTAFGFSEASQHHEETPLPLSQPSNINNKSTNKIATSWSSWLGAIPPEPDELVESAPEEPSFVAEDHFQAVDLIAPSSPVGVETPWSSIGWTSSTVNFDTQQPELQESTSTSGSQSQSTIVEWRLSECNLMEDNDVADCLDFMIGKIAEEFEAENSEEFLLVPRGRAEEEIKDENASLAESFVHLDANNSPPLSNQKSETSSLVKGSGYTSPADDIETAASSDIEIVSTPNGDNWSERSSRSGVTPWTPTQVLEKMHLRVGSDVGLQLNLPTPFGSDRRVIHLTEALEAREKRVFELSTETMQLMEENESLRLSLKNLDFQKRTAEDLQRALNNLQDKYTGMCEERDNFKRRYEKLEREENTSGNLVTQLQRALQDKDQQIQEFQTEGEKLSRQELKHSTIIKKLREKEKDTEKLLETQKQKLLEMESFRETIKEKEEKEIKYDEAIHQLKSANDKFEKRMNRLQAEAEESNAKSATLKSTLDGCYKQISDLTREKAAKDAEIHKLAAAAEASQEHLLQQKLENAENQRAGERQELFRQVEEARMNLVQTTDESERRENSLRWDVVQLQKKLQEAENRNQELSEAVTAATKPLLRQIDSLQGSFSTQQNNWERIEKALYDRVGDTERKLLVSSEKERQATSKMLELRSEMAQMEVRLNLAEKDNKRLEAELESRQKEAAKVQELKRRYEGDLDREKQNCQRLADDMSKEKELLAAQFDFEKNSMKAQLEEKIKGLLGQLEEKDQAVNSLRSQLIEQQLRRTPTPPSRPLPDLRPPSPSSSTTLSYQEEYGDGMWSNGEFVGVGLSALVEKLRARLQQRDGELSVVREELRQVQQSRESLARQLVQVSNQLQDLELKMAQFELLQEKFKTLDGEHQALLQMYGEKVEDNEELRLDLEDVKELYKQQIQEFLASEDV